MALYTVTQKFIAISFQLEVILYIPVHMDRKSDLGKQTPLSSKSL